MQGCTRSRTKMFASRNLRNNIKRDRIRSMIRHKQFNSLSRIENFSALSYRRSFCSSSNSYCSYSSSSINHDERLLSTALHSNRMSERNYQLSNKMLNIRSSSRKNVVVYDINPIGYSSGYHVSSNFHKKIFNTNNNYFTSVAWFSSSSSSSNDDEEQDQNDNQKNDTSKTITNDQQEQEQQQKEEGEDDGEEHTSIFYRLQGCETTSSDSAAERMKIRQSLLKGDSTVLHGPDTYDVTIIGNHDLDDEDVENIIRQDTCEINIPPSTTATTSTTTTTTTTTSSNETSKSTSTTSTNKDDSKEWNVNQPIISVPSDLKSPIPDDKPSPEALSSSSLPTQIRTPGKSERMAAQVDESMVNNKHNKKKEKDDETSKNKPRKRISEVTIAEVLERKHMLKWVDPVVSVNSTVQQAIITCIERGLSGMMVVDDQTTTTLSNKGHVSSNSSKSSDTRVSTTSSKHTSDDEVVPHVVGMLTSRDLLRITASGFKDPTINTNVETIFVDWKIGTYMTPISQVIYARPEETIGMCRTIMAKLGVKCLPILNRGRVEGLVTSRDLSEYGLEVSTDIGGKSNFLKDVSDRVGVPIHKHVVMADPPPYIAPMSSSSSTSSNARNTMYSIEKERVYLNVGIAELPHPFKKPHGELGMTKKQALKLSTHLHENVEDTYSHDVELSEDAHFVVQVKLPDSEYSTNRRSSTSEESSEIETKKENDDNSLHYKDIIYMGVADGVGSWREYGVDPRLFSHSLMDECRNILLEACASRNSSTATTINNHNAFRLDTPAELLAQAYERVKEHNIIGSCTACVAMFDGVHHQLHFSNLGDSGIIVLRHIDSEIAGALKRDRVLKREDRKSDLRVAFVSQQQLESFNHPYQLGWTGEVLGEGESVSFKNANDSCTSSIHVRRGDILIMASDGLFDNVDIDDICQKALEWEMTYDFMDGSHGSDLVARAKRWAEGDTKTTLSAKVIPDLAKDLCEMARDKSLNDTIDSPFAILAKENDIMWSGGMPDDCTVIAMHVVGADATSLSSTTTTTTSTTKNA